MTASSSLLASPIRAVAFDVFGTLCQITSVRPPYKALLNRHPQAIAAWRREVLCRPLSLAQLARELELSLAPNERHALETALQDELASIQLFPEVPQVLENLRRLGLKLAVVSNLASPYGVPARQLLSRYVDVVVWSFEVGCCKPEGTIYSIAAHRLGCKPADILFVGDSLLCDEDGPRRAGLQAVLLDRTGRYPKHASLSQLSELSDLIEANFLWQS